MGLSINALQERQRHSERSKESRGAGELRDIARSFASGSG
jgi:hypothetical protein